MPSVNFLIQSKRNPARIYIRLLDKGTDVKCATNYLINPEDWSSAKQRPKHTKNADLKNLDSNLDTLKANLIKKYNLDNSYIDLFWLKDFINPRPIQNVPKTLIGYIDFYLQDRKDKNNLSEAMRKKVNVVKSKMIRLQKSVKKTYLIKDINEIFLKDFIRFYQDEGYAKNTTHRELVFVKSFCNHAKTKGIPLHPEFDLLSIGQEKVPFVYLSFDEISLIKSVPEDSLPLNLSHARDWLIISCYTAQRVSDFMRFDMSMVRKQSGQTIIEFEQVKTGSLITLPLHPEVMEILDRRGGFPKKLFDTHYNGYIKEVCRLAGIDTMVFGGRPVAEGDRKRKVSGMFPKYELITSHIGRRSFATNFYGKIPTPLLMSATGHTKEETFLTYIGKSPYDKAMELGKYF